jgi:hypothetical protein
MRIPLFIFLLACTQHLLGQKVLSGTISDERQIPIPFAQLYIKNNTELRTVADANGHYELQLYPGEYFVIFNAQGYQDRESYAVVNEQNVTRDIQLFPIQIKDLENVEISVKKSNPGRDIMLNVVKVRDKINPWNYSHSVDAYIRASEKIDRKEDPKKDKPKKSKKDESTVEPSGIDDPFAEERKQQTELANNMNLVEIQLNRSYSPPNKVKEIRNAYDKRGSDKNLYYTTTVKSNFNFFENLLHLDDLHQSPVSSPISGPGILSYKYRLEEQYEENGRKIHKIKIIPRLTATTTLEGYIWVIDSLWLVQKLELTMNKGNLLVYDNFTIKQTFEHPGDSICVLVKQELDYSVKYKDQSSTCRTLALFSNYAFNKSFPPKFFSNELAVTEKEAYEKDSSFWSDKRQVGLTIEERAFIIAKDSIRDVQNRKEYIDSVDRLFNKLTFLKVLWFGIDHRNRAKKSQWTLSSIVATSRPLYIAGPRIAPSIFYFKKWDDERTLDSYTEFSMGILNADPKGRTWWRYRYDPYHLGTAYLQFSHDFDVIRTFDAISQLYKRDNFIETTAGTIGHDYELFNGFYLDANTEFSQRRSIEGYRFLTILDDEIPNNNPEKFETYQAVVLEATIKYTPKQQYMREPYRKVVLGSKFPTFYATYERGIPKLLGSIVDHEFLRIGMMQTFKLGTLGTSSYHLTGSKFLSAKNLQLADFKFQRRSDPFWFSNPLYSFQGQDSSLPSKDIALEFHFVHHDNGAIINKIPFMKKTGIGLVFGGGALYVKEYDWQHYELFFGLERNFKLSKRRLRIGLYAVASDGNKFTPKMSYKISFAMLDERNMKWNF